MENFIIILVLLIIIGSITAYLLKQKKKGQHCIGCPHCKQCSGKCNEIHL